MYFRALHPDFGAEVLDINVLSATKPEIAQLRAALDEHQLLLFRGGRSISPDQQVKICSWFGPPTEGDDGKKWSVLQNEDAAGRIKLPFHADFTYTESPLEVISLHATDVPPGGTSTSFVSGIRGWSDLSPDLQELLAPMRLRHRHVSSVGADWPEFIADHPVRKLHPRSGRPILFVTEHHAHRILELDAEKSDAVLGDLFGHLYGEGHVYTHHWQTNDLVIWDNLAIQHARREAADPSAGKRAVQRVATNEIPFSELLARARRQEAQRRQNA